MKISILKVTVSAHLHVAYLCEMKLNFSACAPKGTLGTVAKSGWKQRWRGKTGREEMEIEAEMEREEEEGGGFN